MDNKEKYYGKKIQAAEFDEAQLLLAFDDGVSIAIWDDAQNCCERRYMRTDDDVSFLVGKTLIAIEEKETRGFDDGGDGDIHDIVFLEIVTDQGWLSISSHNEHNGYYSGFELSLEEVEIGEG